MSLLVLDRVTKLARNGRAEVAVIDNVSMDVAAGELVAVQGRRRSGRTTLLRLAAGVERPDEGTVTFAGRAHAGRRVLGSEIAWAHPIFRPAQGRTMAEHVGFPLLAELPLREARKAAVHALDRLDAGELATMRPGDCRHHEMLIAGIARATITSPRLLVCDEPLTEVSTLVADRVLDLLRAFALDGMAILFTTETLQLGVDRTLTISAGTVRGRTIPPSADVIPLRGESA